MGWEKVEVVEGREEALAPETEAASLTGGTEDSDLKVLEGAASVWRGKESSVKSNYKKKALTRASVWVFLRPHCCRFTGRDEVAELWDVEVRQSHCGCLQQ